jgi:hypothetical protein
MYLAMTDILLVLAGPVAMRLLPFIVLSGFGWVGTVYAVNAMPGRRSSRWRSRTRSPGCGTATACCWGWRPTSAPPPPARRLRSPVFAGFIHIRGLRRSRPGPR